jgi:serine/threonine-protein kinase
MPEDAGACPHCGATALAHDPSPTIPQETVAQTPGLAPQAAAFVAGQMLAGRYRIVTLLGRGGMGEVYHADDLTLLQAVALKFLPAHLADDPDRLERFHAEVRVARLVSHPNVCRVFDVGEADGRPFLSMELIVGKDLSSVLRSVGRPAEERGVEWARQICAGLAAAHDKGVLHRDLKPANVMIDGDGRAHITDFGLAGFAGTFRGHEVRVGTPSYQAPEQLAGREVTIRSDIYALGLVLYEIFTGRAAFNAASLEELRRLRESGTVPTPSSLVRGLTPTLERVILRCLEVEPARRPASALAVAAALPGGDPLAAALAAGETPSPRLVADAGGAGRLPRTTGARLLALILAGMVLCTWLNDFTALYRKVPQELSDRDLTTKAREALRALAPGERPRDAASGFVIDTDALDRLRARDRTAARWAGLETGRPAVLYFWYRQGPTRLVQRLSPNDVLGYGMPGRVTPGEPPLRQPGMACVFLDLEGRLIELHVVPPRSPPESASDDRADERAWESLFQAARLKMTDFRPVAPRREPPVFCTARAAWEGAYPERPDLPVRVEAALWHGRPVYFFLGPADGPDRLAAAEVPGDPGTTFSEVLYAAIRLTVLTVGAWLAARNVRAYRADVRGALRLAGAFAAAYLVKWALMAKHAASANDEWALLSAMVGRIVLDAGTLFLAYLALEPEVRRRWPWRIIGWNRLLAGRWRDPLVGRDVLVGAAVGVAGALLLQLRYLLPVWFGSASTPWQFWEVTLTGGPGVIFEYVHYTIYFRVLDFFLLFLLVLAVRRAWLAVGLWFLVHLVQDTLQFEADHLWLMGVLTALRLGLGTFVLLRFGLLAFVVAAFYFYLLTDLPLTTDVTVWYAGNGLLVLATLAALAVHGFVRAVGERPAAAVATGEADEP